MSTININRDFLSLDQQAFPFPTNDDPQAESDL